MTDYGAVLQALIEKWRKQYADNPDDSVADIFADELAEVLAAFAVSDTAQLLGQEDHDAATWRDVALRLGERLAKDGPNGYYNFSPWEWLNWSTGQVQKELIVPKQTAGERAYQAPVEALVHQTVDKVFDYSLEERIAQWREQETFTPGDLYTEGRALAFGRCADEAELWLKRQARVSDTAHISVPREFLIHIDSIVSLVRHRHRSGIPDDVCREMDEIYSQARKFYEAKAVSDTAETKDLK